MPLKIVRNDITKMNTEAIVNTANRHVTVGPGCDHAVYTAAGFDRLLDYRKDHIGEVPEGESFLTPGFGLPAKYIIHTVSPLYVDGKQGEEQRLRSCYRTSLAIAKENGFRSVAFPLISTGSFGYPKEEGMRIAADEINAFLLRNEMDVFLVVFGHRAMELGRRIDPDLEEYIDRHYVDAKTAEEYDGAVYGAAPGGNDRNPDEEYSSYLPFREMRPLDIRRRTIPGSGALKGGRSTERRDFRKKETEPNESLSGYRETAPEEPGILSSVLPDISLNVPSPYEGELYAEVCPDFEEEHEGRLKERMMHLSDTFSEYLLYLIKEKHMTNAEVYKRAIVDKKIFSKIKNNPDYHPQKLTALCLCVGARLNMDETRDLLARAGYALSPCDRTDIIFSYFIENGIYDMIELDIQLEEHGQSCIIS